MSLKEDEELSFQFQRVWINRFVHTSMYYMTDNIRYSIHLVEIN